MPYDDEKIYAFLLFLILPSWNQAVQSRTFQILSRAHLGFPDLLISIALLRVLGFIHRFCPDQFLDVQGLLPRGILPIFDDVVELLRRHTQGNGKVFLFDIINLTPGL